MHKLLPPLAGIIGLWLGFPNPLVHIPALALLYPAALYACALRAPTWRDALRTGWLTGLAGASACLYWLAVPVHDFGDLPWVLAIPCAVVIGAYVGLYSGLFCLLLRLAKDRVPPARRAILAGVLWFGIEWIRGVLFTGFPWLSLSSAFVPWPVAVQFASVVGGYGLSGIMAAAACLALEAARGRQLVPCAATLAVLVLTVCGWGVHALSSPTGPGTPFGVVMVQGNINQDQKWEPAFQQGTVDKYLELTRSALATGTARLVIWPETSMPFYFQEHKEHGPAIRAFARENGVALLLGTPGYHREAGAGYALYNRAYLIGPDGNDLGHYDKEHLVPFGEYLPPGLNLPFLAKMLQGVGDFTPGVMTKPLRLGELALGMLICYESIFPELALQRVAEGANVLVNISNDAWFGFTAAPEQHIQLSAMRAIEQGRFLLRGTNTGITAVIDPHGRMIGRSDLFTDAAVAGVVTPLTERTLFFRIADWLPLAGAVLALLLLLGKGRPSSQH